MPDVLSCPVSVLLLLASEAFCVRPTDAAQAGFFLRPAEDSQLHPTKKPK